MKAPRYVVPPPAWADHEKPTLPGSPAQLSHSLAIRIAYACVAVLIGLTGGLGTALVTANLPAIQGQLGLTPMEGAWLPVSYVMVNLTANLLAYKFRQQYGIRMFAELGLGLYALLALLHVFVEGWEMALLVRGASGFAGAAASTLAVLYMIQAFPRSHTPAALIIGLSLSQMATPVAWLLSPALLDLHTWPALYALEAGLALCAVAAVVALKLPAGVRLHVFEPLDFLTFALAAPGFALLASVLAQGLNGWWLDTAWLGWALIGAVVLLTGAAAVELRRSNPILKLRWLLNQSTLRFVMGALMMRFLLSEQTYGAIGFLRAQGMGPDQLHSLYAVMLAGLICGMATSAITFGPKTNVAQILLSVVLIGLAGLLDLQSTSQSRPHDFFVSQFMLSFAAAMFLGPLLLIGFKQVLAHGTDHMITFLILFSATQSLGGLAGTAVLGTLQAQRTQVHLNALNAQLAPGNAALAPRLSLQQQQYANVITDPVLRAAQGTAQLAASVRREAAVRAYNDVFAFIAALSMAFLGWSLWRTLRNASDAARRARAHPPSPATA